ncbi:MULTISPECIES: hypothetical protein [unclassified Pseudomonas]|uniref:hypothetical protein n=1 Tax=unclassified Pseudomonas TaxID=196821 RepID=UPI00117B1609|nr:MULTISPECIES: hypothetical protein [unclassified Pseudomonas]
MESTARYVSPMFDAPQYAEQLIELPHKPGKCRDMQIKTKAVLVDAKSKPISWQETTSATWQNRNEGAG